MEAQYGQRIRAMRKSLKLTQEELASKAEISIMSLRRYETNERQPNVTTLKSIANAFGLSIGEFLWEEPINVTVHEQGTGEKYPAELVRFPRGHKMYAPTLQEIEANRDELLACYDDLNPTGQGIAVERVKELSEIPAYKKKAENDTK